MKKTMKALVKKHREVGLWLDDSGDGLGVPPTREGHKKRSGGQPKEKAALPERVAWARAIRRVQVCGGRRETPALCREPDRHIPARRPALT